MALPSGGSGRAGLGRGWGVVAVMVGLLLLAGCRVGGEGEQVAPATSTGVTASEQADTSTLSTAATVGAAPDDESHANGPDRSDDPFVVVAEHPHDPSAYTQGLEFLDDDTLVESTGLRGSSTLRLVDADTGTVDAAADLPATWFGEGATILDDATVWQITWQEQIATRWSLDPLTPLDQVDYVGEGWGLCHDGDRLIMSDGSDTLTFRSPDTFAPEGTVAVTDGGTPVTKINELECVDGSVWANVYQTNWIIVIDPDTGAVTDRFDLSALVPTAYQGDVNLVLNGIARHPTTGRFWITGKQWPVMYEVDFAPSSSPGDG